MIAGEGNGKPRRYRVKISGAVAQQIKEEGRLAAASGRSKQFTDALLAAYRRLRTDPFGFGELTVKHYALGLIAHTGSVAPITLQFAIDKKHAIVYVRKVILRSL